MDTKNVNFDEMDKLLTNGNGGVGVCACDIAICGGLREWLAVKRSGVRFPSSPR